MSSSLQLKKPFSGTCQTPTSRCLTKKGLTNFSYTYALLQKNPYTNHKVKIPRYHIKKFSKKKEVPHQNTEVQDDQPTDQYQLHVWPYKYPAK